MLKIIALALSNKVLPVPSELSNKLCRVVSLSKSISPHVSLYLLLGTGPWELVQRPLTALNLFDLEWLNLHKFALLLNIEHSSE
jgi:hypothetical protein